MVSVIRTSGPLARRSSSFPGRLRDTSTCAKVRTPGSWGMVTGAPSAAQLVTGALGVGVTTSDTRWSTSTDDPSVFTTR